MPSPRNILAFFLSLVVSFLLVCLGFGLTVYDSAQRRLHRHQAEVAGLERELAAVEAALTDLDRAFEDEAKLGHEISALRLHFPCEIDILWTAEDIFRIAKTTPDFNLVVAAQKEPRDGEFWIEHEFLVYYEDASREAYIRSLDALNSTQDSLSITHGSLPYDYPEPIDAHITVSSFTDRCESD